MDDDNVNQIQQKMNIESRGVMQFLHSEAVNGFPKGNFVCSPALADAGLSIIAAGSKGETLKQLLDFLGAESLEDLFSRSSSLKVLGLSNNGLPATTDENDAGPKLRFGNAVWVDKNFPLEPSFVEILRKVYDADANSVDFQNQVDQVIEDVNSWVSNATNGLINGILSRPDIRGDTMFILTSALYFKATWDHGFQFSSYNTQNRRFYLLNGKSKSVLSMSISWKDYDYGCFDGYQVLKIPYKSGGDLTRFSMYFVLPDKKNGLPRLIEKFHSNTEVFRKCFSLESSTLTLVQLPKFKFSYDLNVSDALKKYGLVKPFQPTGELTGIVSQSPEADRMYVQDILMKSCIEVDEDGTEAAAVAILKLRGGGGPIVPYPSFTADHPFMFIIKEEISGAVLFVGSVLDPS